MHPVFDVPHPSAQEIGAFTKFLEDEFDRQDRATPQDPGRVVAHRLNRAEYTNTIRDLLGVEYHADKQFPSDDLSDGFDNIASVLTISPLLMERYLAAAERISSKALGADPFPAKPIVVEYLNKDRKIRRIDYSTIEASHNVEWDADYEIRIPLPGERPKDAAPVTLTVWMDGKPIHEMQAETKPSGLVYFDPFSEEHFRVFLPAGDHVFRVGFVNDSFAKAFSNKDAYDRKKNKFIDGIVFEGPYRSEAVPESRKKILICDPASGPACVNRIVAKLARRAFRRPVSPREVASLVSFVDMAKKDGQSLEQGIQLAIQAMLVSPHFLFRIEHDAGAAAHPISDVELASRLSYFLWTSMPDDELLNLAEGGKLRAPGVLDAQVKRMFADPRSSAFAADFAGQWLETRNLDDVKPDPQRFPAWGPELRDAMKMETRLFFDYIFRQNRPLTEFLDARYTFLNEKLAKHYGIPDISGPEFRKVELTGAQRGGVLSQASVLTVSSYPTRTSVVIRGKYVLQNILGAPPPPPPADVPQLNEAAIGQQQSLRKQMEVHRADAMCASCHNRMDALGFGLENYDGIGKWRTIDGKFPIDSSGTLPNGKSFSDPGQLRQLLLDELPEFNRCLSQKMLTYALGRGLERSDQRAVNDIVRKVAASDYKAQVLIDAVVHSVPFQMGRGEQQKVALTLPKVALK